MARKIMGGVTVLLGLFWMASKAGWIPAHPEGHAVFWPALVILLGLVVIFSGRHGRRHEDRKN